MHNSYYVPEIAIDVVELMELTLKLARLSETFRWRRQLISGCRTAATRIRQSGTESGKRRQLQMTACGHTSPIQVITSSFWPCYAQAIQADNPLSHIVVPLTHSALRPFR